MYYSQMCAAAAAFMRGQRCERLKYIIAVIIIFNLIERLEQETRQKLILFTEVIY